MFRLPLLASLLFSPMLLGGELPTAYNLVDGQPGPWDQRVEKILGEHYRIEHFRASERAYEEPKVLEGEPPEPLMYMEMGKPRQATGVIHVYFVIEADGTVKTAIADRQSGCECLEDYVSDAIKAFRFSPAMLDGEPVASTAVQIYEFKERRRKGKQPEG